MCLFPTRAGASIAAMNWHDFNSALHECELASLYPDYLALHGRRFFDTLSALERARPDVDSPKLLDVGIFPGFMAAMAKDLGYEISGISNEEMTPEFREFARENSFSISQADVESEPLPFKEGQFDAVLCTEIIEHMHLNPFKLIGECARVLRPGGTLLVSTPNLSRLPVIRGLKQGQSYMPSVKGPLDESFPVNPCYKHCREYTMDEIVYMTCYQDKYLYQLEEYEREFSGCWDPGKRKALAAMLNPAEFCNTFLQWLVQTLKPQRKSCLMLSVKKPSFYETVHADSFQDPSGFYDIESDTDSDSMSRRVLESPFRWTNGNASVSFPNPIAADSGPSTLVMQYGYIAPDKATPLHVKFVVDGTEAMQLTTPPSKTFHTVRLPLPRTSTSADRITLAVESSTWSPRDFGMPDDRKMGIMLAWDRLLVCA